MTAPRAERPTRYSSVCTQLKPCMLCDVCVQKAASVGPAGPHLRIKEARRTSRKGMTRETAKQDAQRISATVVYWRLLLEIGLLCFLCCASLGLAAGQLSYLWCAKRLIQTRLHLVLLMVECKHW